MQSLAFFRITTLDALSLCDSSGTLSRRRMKQFFSSLRRWRSITLCVRRRSSSSSVSVEFRDEWWYRDDDDEEEEEDDELREEWWKRNVLSLPLERLLDEGGGEAGQGAA